MSVDYIKSLDVANLLNEGYWEGPYLWGDYYIVQSQPFVSWW